MNHFTIQLLSLFYIYELQNIEINQEIYELLRNQFENHLKRNLVYPESLESPEDKIRYLGSSNMLSKEEKTALFRLMLLYGYYDKLEIRDAIAILTHLKNPNHNKTTIKKLLESPILDDISFNGTDLFTIFSQKYGSFSAQLASIFFKKEPNILHYIQNNDCSKQCQMNTLFLALAKPEYTSVGAQCHYYFKGYYYHFYTYDCIKNQVIDLTLNSVIKKEQYEFLLEPVPLIEVPNEHLLKQMNRIKPKIDQDSNIKLTPLEYFALYEQFKLEKNAPQKRYLSYLHNTKNSA